MTTLNAGALKAIRAVGSAVHAATDVTGFGLLGHLRNILTASHLGAGIAAPKVPALPKAHELIGQGAVAGGTKRNMESTAPITRWGSGVNDAMKTLLNDAQGFRDMVGALAAPYEGRGIAQVVGIESRGFILAGALAQALGAGFVPIWKPANWILRLPPKISDKLNARCNYVAACLEAC